MTKKKSKRANYKPFNLNTLPKNSGSNRGNDSLNTSSDLSLDSESSTSRNNDSGIDSIVIQQSEENTGTRSTDESPGINANNLSKEEKKSYPRNIEATDGSDGYKDMSTSQNNSLNTGTKKKQNTPRGAYIRKSNPDSAFPQNFAAIDVQLSYANRTHEYLQKTRYYSKQRYKTDEWQKSDNNSVVQSQQHCIFQVAPIKEEVDCVHHEQNVVESHIAIDDTSSKTDVNDSWEDYTNSDRYTGLNVNAPSFVSTQIEQNYNKISTGNKDFEGYVQNEGLVDCKRPISRGRGRLDSEPSFSNRNLNQYQQPDIQKKDIQRYPGQGVGQKSEIPRGRGRQVASQGNSMGISKEQQASNTTFTRDDFPESDPMKFKQKKGSVDREKKHVSPEQEKSNSNQNWGNWRKNGSVDREKKLVSLEQEKSNSNQNWGNWGKNGNVDREKKHVSPEQEKSNSNQSWGNNDDTDNDCNWDYPKRHSEGSQYSTKEKTSVNKRYSDPRVTRQNRESFERNSETTDKEYKQFQEDKRHKVEVTFKRVTEIQQDLFVMPKEYSLAHCVAEDMRMGSGIAVSFKRDFKDIGILLDQRQKQGGVAILEHDGRYVYYLVTKRVSNGKPTYDTMWSSLKKMRDHIKEHSVAKLAIPRLGCGLDRLEWDVVKHMIEFLFGEVDVEITVCNFQQTEDSPEKPPYNTCKIVNVSKPVADIEEETSIMYLSTEDGHISTEMEELESKFHFLNGFKRSRKEIGTVIKYEVPNKYYVLNGCIVRKTKAAPFNFEGFRKCVQQVVKDCRKGKYFYIAIQTINDASDDLINDKIVTILKNYVSSTIHVYVCWDGDLVSQMPERL